MEISTPDATRERAPILRVFGGLSARVAPLLLKRPSLALRLSLAPPEAIHAVAAYLYLASDVGRSVHDVAARIDGSDPRDLLYDAIPNAPRRLYRALAAAGNKALSEGTYMALRDAVRGPYAEFLFDDDVTAQRILYVAAMTDAGPAVANLCRLLPAGAATFESVTTVVQLLVAFGLDVDKGLNLSQTTGGANAAVKRLLALVDSLSAPDPGFELPGPLRLIGTVGALRRAGREFRNCLGNPYSGPDHWMRLVAGSSIYVVSADPCFMASIARIGSGLCAIEDIAAPGNKAPSAAARLMVVRALRAAGQQVADTLPQHALGYLCGLTYRRGKDPAFDLEEGANPQVA